MGNYAIVIGIDAYANREWELSAAVNEALAFTDWALGAGDVAAENLNLLLSPARKIQAPVPYQEANTDNILTAISQVQNGAGRGLNRLFFYYAGHGLSASGVQVDGQVQPVLIPVNVTALDAVQSRNLIGFSGIMPALSSVEPSEQFFFIDACRDFALEEFWTAIGPSVFYRPSRAESGSQTSQYVLYATSPGQKAYAKRGGLGVFGQALMDGLSGRLGAALTPSRTGPEYHVGFSSLYEAVRERVKNNVPSDGQRYIQLPKSSIPDGPPNPLLASLPSEAIDPVRLLVRVKPSPALSDCAVKVLQYVAAARRDIEIGAIGPPTPIPAFFDLRPDTYALQVEARSYRPFKKAYPIYERQVVDITLEKDQQESSQTFVEAVNPDTPGRLIVKSADSKALIAVWDAERQPVNSGFGECYVHAIRPGYYSIRMQRAEGGFTERIEQVYPGQTLSVNMDAPRPHIGEEQRQMLSRVGIATDSNSYLYPSELMGAVADPRLASLLGFAALAAHRPDDGDMWKLRQLGVHPVTDTRLGDSGLMILLAANGSEPVPGLSREEFLANARLVPHDQTAVGPLDQIVGRGRNFFEPLEQFPAAAQWMARTKPFTQAIGVAVPGMEITNYAITCLPDRVTVLIIVAEDSGEIEVQQYMLPLIHLESENFGIRRYLDDRGGNIRRVELAQRHYASGQSLKYEQLVDLLYGKWLDPLLGCLGGYSLIRAGKKHEYIGNPTPDLGPEDLEQSAMRNMLKFFGQLPDSHVLAGLCQADERDFHFENALKIGLPVFREGYQALEAWNSESTNKLLGDTDGGRHRLLLSGSTWTAWVERPLGQER